VIDCRKPDDSDRDEEIDNEMGEPKSSTEVEVKSSAESPSTDLGATTVDTTTDKKSVTG
jgi:hypothetical protein